MGVDCRAQLLVGVHLETRFRSVEKTKYDPDTGKPYTMKERQSYRTIVGTDIEISASQTEDLEWNTDGRPQLTSACYDDPDGWFIGIVVAETQSNRYGSPFWRDVPDNLVPVQLQITKLLVERFGYGGQVGVFLLNHMS